MKKFWKENKLSQMLLSLIMAVFVWAFAISELNPSRVRDFSAIPVQFLGTETLAEQNLVMIAGQDTTVRMYLEGTIDNFAKLHPSNIAVTVDLSEITAPGEYQISGSDVNVAIPISGLKLSSFSPRTLNVTIDRIISRQFPITAQVAGSPAAGYRHRATQLGVDAVTITGPETLLQEINDVVVSVESNGLRSSMVYTAPIVLLDAEKNVIQSENLTLSFDTVDVTLWISQEGELPLQVNLIPSDTLHAEDVEVNIEPKSIAVHADQAILKNYPALTIGQIDLSEINLSGIYTFPIQIPNRLTAIGDVPLNAEVTVSVREQSSKQFTIAQFELHDVAEIPAEVEVMTESVDVSVVGLQRFVDALDESDIEVSLSYDSSVLGEGEHALQAQISVKPQGNYELSSETAILDIVLTMPEIQEPEETEEAEEEV